LIALEGVAKRFGERMVLPATNLALARGRSMALVGPSGCGKSTLLRIIVGLLTPDTGRVVVDGLTIAPDTLTPIRRRIGYVIQEGGLFPHLKARENVSLLARHLHWPNDRIARRLGDLAALVRVDLPLLDRYPSELSGGERQRVGMMRALMLDPPVLLLDEPMGALDPLVRARLRPDLKRIFCELGKTVVLVTHDVGEASFLCDELALMRAGFIVQRGTLRALVEAPVDPFVRDFVGAQGAACDGSS
jgi:osmoprotectant transport system ATP-binding protein